jgi:hypothetical protein
MFESLLDKYGCVAILLETAFEGETIMIMGRFSAHRGGVSGRVCLDVSHHRPSGCCNIFTLETLSFPISQTQRTQRKAIKTLTSASFASLW